jgi:tetratricopeptide (TPR) repeat protein
VEIKQAAVAAFINANAGGARAVLTEVGVTPDLLRPDLQLAPAGVFWKVVPSSGEARIEERYWRFPLKPEDIRPQYRRARGQVLTYAAEGVRVKPQVYESRLNALILRAWQRLALAHFQQQHFAEAARLFETVVRYGDEEFSGNPELIHLLAISTYGAGQFDQAEPYLLKSVQISIRRENRATALFYLGEIASQRGDVEGSRRYREQALHVPGLDPATLRELERRKQGR